MDLKPLGDGIPLSEAELVVSAGRGLKGPENWGIVEDLALSLVHTACSSQLQILDGDLITNMLVKLVLLSDLTFILLQVFQGYSTFSWCKWKYGYCCY